LFSLSVLICFSIPFGLLRSSGKGAVAL
jgi:hypothetical protein